MKDKLSCVKSFNDFSPYFKKLLILCKFEIHPYSSACQASLKLYLYTYYLYAYIIIYAYIFLDYLLK